VPLLWLRARRSLERRAAGRLLLAGLIAAAFAVLFFYTAFAGLIVEQLGGVVAGGLNGATGRNPIPRATTLWVTWQGGLITHFGFFPVLLVVPGAIMLAYRMGRGHGGETQASRGTQALVVLLGVTLLVSL